MLFLCLRNFKISRAIDSLARLNNQSRSIASFFTTLLNTALLTILFSRNLFALEIDGTAGLRTNYNTGNVENFSPAPFLNTGSWVTDSIFLELQFKYVVDRLLWNGVGQFDTAQIYETAFVSSFDLTEKLNYDLNFSYAGGTNSFSGYEIYSGFTYRIIPEFSVSADAYYDHAQYTVLNIFIEKYSYGVSAEFSYSITEPLAVELGLDYFDSQYLTIINSYQMTTGRTGFSYYQFQQVSYGAGLAFGADSADYLMFGSDVYLRIYFNENVVWLNSIDFEYYSTSLFTSSKGSGKNAAAQASSRGRVNPLSTSDSFWSLSWYSKISYDFTL
ncbi:MAG: hypothetical protein KDK38_10465 [Leptospiraceae bacterium]|nr:hypothetical protein [Leptospiraceae bacterium]